MVFFLLCCTYLFLIQNQIGAIVLFKILGYLYLICLIPGYVSKRHPRKGTWIIQCLCKVFLENYEKLEIREMLDKVSAMLTTYESPDGQKQSCEYNVRTLKKLYF